METVKDESVEAEKDYKQICAKCYMQILQAFQDVVQHKIEVGNSAETETFFMDDKSDQKFKMYIKVTNEGKPQNEPM